MTKGEVPLSQTQGENAVWFTSDVAPEEHGLMDGHVLTVEEREAYRRSFGKALSEGARFPDKRRVRIEVVISSSDRALKPWLPWARKRLSPDWLAALSTAGGGLTSKDVAARFDVSKATLYRHLAANAVVHKS